MTCARTSRSNKTRAHPPSSRRERARFDALRTFAMGRGRRGARSSDDEDDGVSPAPRGVQSSQVSGGGRAGKKWQPGMSGSQQKARAKEQRLEQERRKAERERRNEDKRAERDRLHRTEAHRDTLRPPASIAAVASTKVPRPRRGHPRPRPRTSTPPTTWTPPACAASSAASSAASNTAAASLFSPAASSSSTTSSSSSTSRRWRSGKSGAGAWSQRLQKGGERDVSLSAFLAMNGARDVAGSPSVYSSSPTSGLGAGFAGERRLRSRAALPSRRARRRAIAERRRRPRSTRRSRRRGGRDSVDESPGRTLRDGDRG